MGDNTGYPSDLYFDDTCVVLENAAIHDFACGTKASRGCRPPAFARTCFAGMAGVGGVGSAPVSPSPRFDPRTVMRSTFAEGIIPYPG
jgi:hypothetical protein